MMDTGWLTSTVALIAAFAALLASMGALLPQIRQKKRAKVDGTPPRWAVILGVALLVFSGIVFGVRLLNERNQPLNVKLTTAAWNALNKGDYTTAISTADDCISHFRSAADTEEMTLESAGAPLPATGQTGPEEKERILKRGVLNDAAACFFIRGEATSRLGRKNDAIDAYRNVVRYKYGRVYDPSGFFWAPSEAAEERLNELRK
jgi:hypothetical protein